MPKTKRTIIQETKALYGRNPYQRAIKENTPSVCQYRTKDGRMCAVGRCLDPEHPEIEAITEDFVDATTLIKNYGDEIFKPEYRGHAPAFWQDLQDFHDSPLNFDFKGRKLSPYGEGVIYKIKAQWLHEVNP